MTWHSVRWRAGVLLAGALGAVALLTAYWAGGGTWGLAAATGDPTPYQPPAGMMWFVTVLLVGWMMMVLGAVESRCGDRVRRFCRFGCFMITLVLLEVALMFFQGETRSEQVILGPLVLLLAVAAAVLVRDGGRTRRLLSW